MAAERMVHLTRGQQCDGEFGSSSSCCSARTYWTASSAVIVFTTDTEALINPSNLRQRSFAALLKRSGLPHMRFHDLRHACATMLLSRGVHPKFVQELLGHATIAITLDTYSHVMPSMGDATTKAMQDTLA
jgi:integrase